MKVNTFKHPVFICRLIVISYLLIGICKVKLGFKYELKRQM